MVLRIGNIILYLFVVIMSFYLYLFNKDKLQAFEREKGLKDKYEFHIVQN